MWFISVQFYSRGFEEGWVVLEMSPPLIKDLVILFPLSATQNSEMSSLNGVCVCVCVWERERERESLINWDLPQLFSVTEQEKIKCLLTLNSDVITKTRSFCSAEQGTLLYTFLNNSMTRSFGFWSRSIEDKSHASEVGFLKHSCFPCFFFFLFFFFLLICVGLHPFFNHFLFPF